MKVRAWMLLGVIFVAFSGSTILADETVIFPFWQKGYGMNTFFSVANAGTLPVTVQIELLLNDGSLHALMALAPGATINPGQAWSPDTSFGMPVADGAGFGRYIITSTENATYVWSCLYSYCPGLGGPGVDAQPGFTMTIPQIPCGNPALE
jgi:hypothetical protein